MNEHTFTPIGLADELTRIETITKVARGIVEGDAFADLRSDSLKAMVEAFLEVTIRTQGIADTLLDMTKERMTAQSNAHKLSWYCGDSSCWVCFEDNRIPGRHNGHGGGDG